MALGCKDLDFILLFQRQSYHNMEPYDILLVKILLEAKNVFYCSIEMPKRRLKATRKADCVPRSCCPIFDCRLWPLRSQFRTTVPSEMVTSLEPQDTLAALRCKSPVVPFLKQQLDSILLGQIWNSILKPSSAKTRVHHLCEAHTVRKSIKQCCRTAEMTSLREVFAY